VLAIFGCRRIALYAVDSLRQLVGKLLARAELEHFTHQEEALRPFVAVLRQCDEACVRELAVQCVMQVRCAGSQGVHLTPTTASGRRCLHSL
jgi:hypothetical protein